jgi:NTE family protein
MTRIYFLLVLFFVSLAGHAFCEDPEARPKIGLVLSGGGAKGLAHIGILRAMEKAGLTQIILPEPAWGASLVRCTL